MKKIVALVLAMVMVLGLATVASAATTTTYQFADLTLTDAAGTSATYVGNTSTFTKVDAVTNTTTINGVTTVKVTPAYYQGIFSDLLVECDKSVADLLLTIKNVGSVYVKHMAAAPTVNTADAATAYTAPKLPTCGMVGADEDTYFVIGGKYYAEGTGKYALLNGNLIECAATASAPKAHNFNDATVEAYNTKYPNMADSVKCADCKGIVTLYTKVAPFDGNEYAKVVTTNTALHGYTYYYVVGAAAAQAPAADATEKVESAQTFDAGIAMYVGMSVMAAAGSAVVLKKKD